jgi:hypothetical protein
MISTVESQPSGSIHDLVQQVAEIFSSKGILSRSKNFEFRPQQQEMAVAVAQALANGEHLAVEAGTGVGKSLAYLVPAILYAVANKKKAVISTHTINLQEQLTQKDLPMLEQILPVKFSFTMLKGRGNYLCTRRLHKAVQQAGNLFTSSEAEELQRIHEWSKTTTDGSLSDFEAEPDPKVWAQVCSERGLCSPKLCGYPSDFGKDHPICFFQRARNRILSSDVLVVNLPAHRAERIQRPGALRLASPLESPHRKGPARHVAQGRRGEARRRTVKGGRRILCQRRNGVRSAAAGGQEAQLWRRGVGGGPAARVDGVAHPPAGVGPGQRHAPHPAPA